jgi:hypothetical protein
LHRKARAPTEECGACYLIKKEHDATKPHALPKCNRWNGEAALNKTSQLLLVSEQGLGDTLQFIRYTNALREQGASVSFCGQPELHNLINASGIDPSPLTPEQANQVSEGEWIPLLSVPRCLEVSPGKPIITEPYIKTTDELIDKWKGILSAEQRPIIGSNWQGNQKTEKKGIGDVQCHWKPLPQSQAAANYPCSHSKKGIAASSSKAVPSRIVSSAARIKPMPPGIFWRPLPSSPTAIWSSPATPLWLTWQEEWARQPGYCSRRCLNGAGF